MTERKIAVLFPGIGYTCEKPLLYYSGKIAREAGYEVIELRYGGFPANVRGDREKMRLCFDIAFEQAREQLAGVDWKDCGKILLIGKSVGTIVAAAWAKEAEESGLFDAAGVAVNRIYLTPLPETFRITGMLAEDRGRAIAFHGTADPWADTGTLREAAEQCGIPLTITRNTNHSLETGRVETDIRILADTMEEIERFIMLV